MARTGQTKENRPGNPRDDIPNVGGFIWSIAEILRGDFKQSEYGKVVLPFVVLRRVDCTLEDTKNAVLEAEKTLPGVVDYETRSLILHEAARGQHPRLRQQLLPLRDPERTGPSCCPIFRPISSTPGIHRYSSRETHMFQCDSDTKDAVLSDAEARDQAIRHFFIDRGAKSES